MILYLFLFRGKEMKHHIIYADVPKSKTFAGRHVHK